MQDLRLLVEHLAGPNLRMENMKVVGERIAAFRASYPQSMEWSRRAGAALQAKMDSIYRDCQEFATVRIRKAVDELFQVLHTA